MSEDRADKFFRYFTVSFILLASLMLFPVIWLVLWGLWNFGIFNLIKLGAAVLAFSLIVRRIANNPTVKRWVDEI